MATPETLPIPVPPSEQNEQLAQHQRRLHRALRLPRRRELPVQGAQGPDARARGEDLGVQVRAAVDARLPAQGARPLPRPPDADLGLADAGRGRLRRHPLLRPRLRARRALLGRRARGRQEDLRPARDPRGRAQVPLRRRRPVRVRGRLPPGPRGPREAGRDLHRHGLGAARARGPRARVLRDDHPAQRQQARRAQQRRLVGRLVRLRAAGRARRDAAAGLLPHQHRVDGPVRADADHRRRGLLRALRRGLHGADLQLVLAALRGRRADRQARRADPLHDRAELVDQRLQPRHQARGRRRPTRPSSGSTATSARS